MMNSGNELVTCDVCGRPFTSETSLKKHLNAPAKGTAPTESGQRGTCPTLRGDSSE